jgi:hypothetical protein
MSQRHASDWLLVLSVLTGLYSPVALAGILLAVVVRGEFVRLHLRIVSRRAGVRRRAGRCMWYRCAAWPVCTGSCRT